MVKKGFRTLKFVLPSIKKLNMYLKSCCVYLYIYHKVSANYHGTKNMLIILNDIMCSLIHWHSCMAMRLSILAQLVAPTWSKWRQKCKINGISYWGFPDLECGIYQSVSGRKSINTDWPFFPYWKLSLFCYCMANHWHDFDVIESLWHICVDGFDKIIWRFVAFMFGGEHFVLSISQKTLHIDLR